MPGMKISVDAAMRARDVSQPTAADEVAAASLTAPGDKAQPPGQGRGGTAGQAAQQAAGAPRLAPKKPRFPRRDAVG
jgi:hypothetical protein